MRNTVLASTLNRGTDTVNRGRPRNDARSELRQRLMAPLTSTVRQLPPKDMAIATGIPWRTLENLRQGVRLCNLEQALLIIKTMPNSPFASEIAAFLSGDGVAASPASIDVLVRFFNQQK